MACVAHAQILSPVTDTLEWQSGEFYNTSNQETVSHQSKFTTGTSEILWDQLNGESSYTFTIVSTDGEWNDVNTDGARVYHVTKGPTSGTLTFQRENGITKVTMEFIKNGTNVMPYVFTVSAVSKL